MVGGPSVTYPVLIGLTLAVSRARTFPPPPRVVGHSIDWKVTEQWLLWQTEVSHVLKG